MSPSQRNVAAPSSVSTVVLDPAQVAASYVDLPTLAPVAMRLVQLADDDRATMQDIADTIGHDPGLAAQLLRVANSAVYAPVHPTTSLTRAATVLGVRMIKLLSLTFSVVSAPKSADPMQMLTWRHMLATSALARSIAATFQPRLVEECFVAGLLGAVGRAAMIELPAYRSASQQAGGVLDAAAERAVVGCTSAAVSAHLMDSWGLPRVLVVSVTHRDDPDAAEGAAARIGAVLAVADAAASVIVASAAGAAAALSRFRELAGELFDVDATQADQLLVDAADSLTEVAELFSSAPPHEVPVSAILSRAKSSLIRLGLDAEAAVVQAQSQVDDLARQVQVLTAQACTDPLTGLANRRAYDTAMNKAIVAAQRRGPDAGGVGLILVDVDKFKAVNDSLGHDAGDDILQQIAQRLRGGTRREELPARLGGEEFTVILPVAYTDELPLAAERIRALLSDTTYQTSTGPLPVTVSVGAAILTAPGGDEDIRRLFKAADDAVLAAKAGGRNRVVLGAAL